MFPTTWGNHCHWKEKTELRPKVMRVHEDKESSLKENRSQSKGTIMLQEEPTKWRRLNISSKVLAARHGRRASNESRRKRSEAKNLA